MSLLDNPFGMQQRQSSNDIYRVLSFGFCIVVLFMLFDTYVQKPQREAMLARQKPAVVQVQNVPAPEDRDLVLAESTAKRATLENNELKASIDLKGARLDDLVLKNYFETVDNEKNVALLSPSASTNPQLVQFGWISSDSSLAMPNDDTNWTVADQTPQSVTLKWTSPQNLVFEQIITLDDNSLFTVEKKVVNNSGKTITVYPYGRIAREGLPHLENAAISHEGPIAYTDGKLTQEKFKQLDKDKKIEPQGKNGWIGITEKYWLAALLNPPSTGANDFRFITGQGSFGRVLYQADTRGAAETLAPGETGSHTNYAFVGPKRVKLLDHYSKKLDLAHFDLAVDFGKFYFLTRPFFGILQFWSHLLGSFAIGLLLTALTIRMFTFPLANTTYRSFAKLRVLAPVMQELKEKYAGDRQKLQMELMKVYQKEKVNPAAGCLPILLQIPIFFALYKVLFVTIEMRHQSFPWWVKDMAAADPTSIFNLFGFIPWTPPQALMIGGWACVYCLTMLALQRLQPPPPDAQQRTIMRLMPFMFTFMMAHFPVGLVIYWCWSNILSIIQQSIIMKSMGVKIYLFHSDKHSVKDVEILDPKDDVVLQTVESVDVTPEAPKEISPPKRGKKKK